MLGIAFQLDFVTSFCREYGAWICPKNGTRTAELVQQQQQEESLESTKAVDESFPLFFGRDPCIYSAPNTTALCSRYVHLTLKCCAVLRSICCIMQLVLLWCYSLQWHWQLGGWQVHSPNNPTHGPSSSPFPPFFHFCHFHHFHHFDHHQFCLF